ncbi:prostasin-like isoform X2 [Ruditapes philippinarum]|uniref:prostasin-like isoform X2 n=1 Tax=Ruditapes philippinarum TaxID=129788 RepID=UPI00295B7BEA|nr:prostasin-like isoform X2 [Ruditapes philippinarum]
MLNFLHLLRVLGLQNPDIYGNQCGLPMFEPTSLSQQTPLGKRIVGGTEANPGSWPWMVMLKKNGRIKCGGSILDSHIILTAAHCLYSDRKYDEWQVFVGKHHTNVKDKNEQSYTISKFIPHERFDRNTLMNDIALIVLKEPIKFNPYVRPICLPQMNQPESDQCYTTGWGETKGTGYADVLKEIPLAPKMKFFCRNLLKKLGRSQLRNIFCAGYQNADACSGDSGGPYSCRIEGRWFVKGVVSFGPDCGQPGWTGVYVNVMPYLSWIKNHINQSI